ncbi:hypothetical protein O988_04213 [Pseudogymnoascus sp. VKM F-3808]|nr:hypothetical protein O988_04213 [Pseudogymnoascus sp. VKM F-3808]
MAPRRIGSIAEQEPWETEENFEYDDGYYEDHDEDQDYNGDATDSGWEPSGEWDLNSADAEEVSALATGTPETEEPYTTEAAPEFAEESLANPSTFVASEDAPVSNDDYSAANFDAESTPDQPGQEAQSEAQKTEYESLRQDESLGLQTSPVRQKLTPEEQAIKDREAWQIAVAERKERLRLHQMAKDENARKLFDIFQKERQEEKLKAAKKVVAVNSGRFKGRITKRGVAGDIGKKVVGKVINMVADKVADRIVSKKPWEGDGSKEAPVVTDKATGTVSEEEGEEEEEDEERPVFPTIKSSSDFHEHPFMDILMRAVKGPNVPVLEGLPGITSYDEDAPTNPEDPRRIHRVLKIVLGRELFEELNDLPLDTYEAQDYDTREELVHKVLFKVKENPATEKIKMELLEGLAGLGDCGLPLPLRKPLVKAVDLCEHVELCTPGSPCAVADLCHDESNHEAGGDITTTGTTLPITPDNAERKVSPMQTLFRLFRAAIAPLEAPKEAKSKFYEGFRGIGQREVGPVGFKFIEFEAYRADLNNACNFNMWEVPKAYEPPSHKLSPNFKSVEHTTTVEGAIRKPQVSQEQREGASQNEKDKEGADDKTEDNDEEGAEGGSDNENEDKNEDDNKWNPQKEKSNESVANGMGNNAGAIKDSEDITDFEKSTARYGNHRGWFPYSVFGRSVEPDQDDFPAVEGAPVVPSDNDAQTEFVDASTLSEADSERLIGETITVASLGPALPPPSTPESIFRTGKPTIRATVTEGLTEDSVAVDATPRTASSASEERKMAYKAYKSKPSHTMSKEASAWDRAQRQRARRIEKARLARARALRRIQFAKKLEAERARKAADRAASLEEIDYQPPQLSQHGKRAPPSPLRAHAPAYTGQGVKEEEQRWRAGEGQLSTADREEAAREIAKVAKLREVERQKGVEDAAAAAKAAAQDDGVGNPYLDHNSYDPAQAHMDEAAAGVRFQTYKGVGDSTPELGNLGVGVVVLMWIALMVAILRCQRRRPDGSPNWARERGRGFWSPGRKKRQSEEQDREKLDV